MLAGTYKVICASNMIGKFGGVSERHGYIAAGLDTLFAGQLRQAVAEEILSFNRKFGFPTTLAEISGFDWAVFEIIPRAAKGPQLESKLQNMPVPPTADLLD